MHKIALRMFNDIVSRLLGLTGLVLLTGPVGQPESRPTYYLAVILDAFYRG